ncbi:hypothetical protein DB41_EI00300 [Neochlamydia sp. TUME1]|nr:hypothetical protein DB41_EI00300 [Neochlamydia sp. TUME1]
MVLFYDTITARCLLSDKQLRLSHMIYKWLGYLTDDGSLEPIPLFTLLKILKQFILNIRVHRS